MTIIWASAKYLSRQRNLKFDISFTNDVITQIRNTIRHFFKRYENSSKIAKRNLKLKLLELQVYTKDEIIQSCIGAIESLYGYNVPRRHDQMNEVDFRSQAFIANFFIKLVS